MLAVAMTMVWLFDGVAGFQLREPGRAYGPIAFAAITLACFCG
jgi:hypothetical protein